MQHGLKHLGLTQLEKALPQLFETARQEQWTYETFFNHAIAAEIEGRDRRAAERRMVAAHLPTIKTLEAFDFSFQPSLSERLLWELADLSFVQTATNVVFLGPPGVGKTHLSLALSVKALAAGHSALFTTLSHLAESLETASHPGLMRQRLRRYTTPSVLVIDEVGYTRLTPDEGSSWYRSCALSSRITGAQLILQERMGQNDGIGMWLSLGSNLIVGCCCRGGQTFCCWNVAAIRVRKQLGELGQL